MTTQESTAIAAVAAPVGWPCGFWRRVGAVCIDSLVLGAVGICLGFAWGDWFATLGESGRWIGFVVAGVYFILLQARTGQSLGKMALGLKVMRLDGAPINARQATVRYAALGLPWVLNGMFFTGDGFPLPLLVALGIVLIVVVFAGLIGNLYLLLFNRPSRRLIHDWIAATVVVRVPALPCVPDSLQVNLKRVHLGMMAGLSVALCGGFFWIWQASGAKFSGFAVLTAIQRQVNSLPGVQSSRVTERWSSGSKRDQEHYMSIAIRLAPSAHQRRRAIELAAVAKAIGAWKAGPQEGIFVQVIEGYDIAIASKWWSEGESQTIAQWLQVLREAGVDTADQRI